MHSFTQDLLGANGIELKEVRHLEMMVEICCLGVHLIQENVIWIRCRNTHIKLQTVFLQIHRGFGVCQHAGHEILDVLRVNLKINGDDKHDMSLNLKTST
jgi:hypothetical protein